MIMHLYPQRHSQMRKYTKFNICKYCKICINNQNISLYVIRLKKIEKIVPKDEQNTKILHKIMRLIENDDRAR